MKAPKLSLFFVAGLFIISCVTLMLELLISRIMSVVAWYHFAFMAISIALFGMTLGACLVFLKKKQLVEQFNISLAKYCIYYVFACLIAIVCISNLTIFYNRSTSGDWNVEYDLLNASLIFGSLILPFICLGVCLALIFTHMSVNIGKIYAINLIASATGCLLFIPAIGFLGGVNTFIVLSWLGIVAAYLFILGGGLSFQFKKIISVTFILVTGILFLNIKFNLIDLKWAKGQLNYAAFYKKWNAFSYLRAFNYGNSSPVLWGVAPKKLSEVNHNQIKQIYLDIDAIAGTIITRFDGHLNKINFLRYDISALPYYLVRNGDVLVIGVGGGRDILTGLLFGQRSITGVEINEGILFLLNDLLGNFSGRLKFNPKIHFIHDEARSYISSSSKKYDLIQISLIDTFAASMAGTYALTENGLYTQEAFGTYLRHLKDNGFLSVSYWYQPGDPKNILRLTGIATKALENLGVKDVRDHLIIVHKDAHNDGRGVATILVKKSLITGNDLFIIRKLCQEMGFIELLSPHQTLDERFAQMSNPGRLDSFTKQFPLDISPPTDDKPFFFLFEKMRLLNALNITKWSDFSAESILFSLFFIMLLLTVIFVLLPLLKLEKKITASFDTWRFSIYFSSIGIAFMLIEVSQITRLSLFLGHPIFSLAVVLFSLLLSTGIGSWTLGKMDNSNHVKTALFIFMLISLTFSIITSPLLDYFSVQQINVRLLLSVLLILPIGVFMGMFFPQGIRLLEQKSGPVALYWGLNGGMSVVGSILAMILLTTLGIQNTFYIGVVLYLLAIISFLEMLPK